MRNGIPAILAPSILAADFARLGEQIKAVEGAGATYLHTDVMDGCFVPNISIGPPVIKSIRKVTGMVIDAHLMIVRPERYIEAFAEAGADIINVHAEACDPGKVIEQIHRAGKRAGLTIKPETPADTAIPFLADLDLILVMSVEPGFGGQKLLPETLKKAGQLAQYIARHNLRAKVEMDGGVDIQNVRSVLSAGVDIVVAGSAVFGAPDPAAEVKRFMDIFGGRGIE
jgi:ribulose-phosphate 3-epimerase